MSTLQTTPQHHTSVGSRPRGKVLALSTLAAIGLALLILVATNQRATAPATRGIAHQAGLTAQAPVPAECFRDPATHALTCSHTALSPAANPAPAGYFRDPATHKLTRLPTALHPAMQQPANHSRGRVIP